MKLDLSLSNQNLYAGLQIEQLAGRLTLLTSPEEAIPVIVGNLQSMTLDPNQVVLTGSMAIWAYLVIFHYLHGRTRRIFYEDGRGMRVLVAAHG